MEERDRQVSYDGGGRRGVEEPGPARGGCGGGQRRAAAVGPGEPSHQQSRHVRVGGIAAERSDLTGSGGAERSVTGVAEIKQRVVCQQKPIWSAW